MAGNDRDANTPLVLIVDDDTISRMLLQHMVNAQGYGVLEASSVDAALELLESNTIDLVICDYVMPEKDGLDLLQAMRGHAAPFVLLTGAMDESELGDDRVSEVSAYLTKPVASERLQEVVGRMLNDGAPAKV